MRPVILTAVAAGLLAFAPVAHADPDSDDPDTTREVCGAFNYGQSQDQIAQNLHRNDHRINEWQAQRDTNWPIIEGDCG